MINRKGCLIQALKDGDIDILVHQVNCQGVMGSGIAGQIRGDFPQHYTDYMTKCRFKSPDDLLGEIVASRIHMDTDLKMVTGIFGQLNYGRGGERFTNYASLLKGLGDIFVDFAGCRIGIPKYIGCGLGGGDWKILEPLISDLEALHEQEILVYEK